MKYKHAACVVWGSETKTFKAWCAAFQLECMKQFVCIDIFCPTLSIAYTMFLQDNSLKKKMYVKPTLFSDWLYNYLSLF